MGQSSKQVQDSDAAGQTTQRNPHINWAVVNPYFAEQSGVKKRYRSCRFENFVTDTAGRKKACETARNYADNFGAYKKNGDGLYIEGTFGTGKTHLAAAVANLLIERGHEVIFGTAEDLLRKIKAEWDNDFARSGGTLERFRDCELLVIDDLGKEQVTDWSTSQLYSILNDRYENEKPVIITTNFNEKDLIAIEAPKGTGAHRIKALLSRLHETCISITMNWQDWRGKS